MTRLQGSLHATARVLAPSKEALDTPLSPPPLSDEPGPATEGSGAYPDGTFTRRPGPASRTQHGSTITRNADIRSTTRSTRVIISVRIMLSSWEPPIGIEPMTYALRGACALPGHALAAPTAPAIALTALAALGLSDDPVHEPVHASGLCVLSSRAVRDLPEDAVSADANGPCRVMSRQFTDHCHM
jgi:hypothetical protein